MTKVTPERSRRSVKPPERFLNDYLLEKSFSSEKPTTLGKILKSKSAKGTCETIFQCTFIQLTHKYFEFSRTGILNKILYFPGQSWHSYTGGQTFNVDLYICH